MSDVVKWKCKKVDDGGKFFIVLEVDASSYKTVEFGTEQQRDAAYFDFVKMMDECGSIGVNLQ